MSDYNINLLIKRIEDTIESIETIKDKVGNQLVKNIRKEADKAFGNSSKYPYDFKNDFADEDTVKYVKEESVVQIGKEGLPVITLEFGLSKDVVIRPKNAQVLHFIGQDGEDVYTDEVVIPKGSRPPVGYTRKAINKTKTQINKLFNGKIEVD